MKKRALLLGIIPFLIFVSMITFEIFRKSNYNLISQDTELNIDVTHLKTSRDVLIINDKFTLSSSCKLISNNNRVTINEKNPPLWSSSKSSYNPVIGDIIEPYLLIKKRNNDSLFVVKNKDTLVFQRHNY